MDDDRLDWHLANWTEWQRDRASDYGCGYPGRASGRMGQSGSRDFDALLATADAQCARAVEAILEGACTPVERCAVHHVHLAAVFRFPRLGRGAEIAYQAARVKIRDGLVRRGIQ